MAVVCLVLLALLTVVQVTHIHPTESAADQCPLCISMHSAAPVAVAAAVVVMVPVGFSPIIFHARPVVRYWSPKLFTRPPPADC